MTNQIVKKTHFSKGIKTILLVDSIVMVAAAMLGPIYALFVEEIGGSLLDASFAAAIFAVVGGITCLISGNLTDKIKENELIIVFGYFMLGIGFFLYTFVDSILFLFGVQVIVGLAHAVSNPALDAVFSKHLDKGKVGKEWGAWEALGFFTYAIGAVVGGLIVINFGFDAIFIIMSILCFASAIYIYLLPRDIL